MPPKRVSINISLPNSAFKRRVKRIAKHRGKSPSKEFQELYESLTLPDDE